MRAHDHYSQARALHREWLTKIEGRINNIRAERKGEGITLTPKDVRALSGEWYLWYIQRHTDRPSPKAHWELFLELLTDQIFRGAEDVRDHDDPYSTITKTWEVAEADEPCIRARLRQSRYYGS